MSEESKTVTVEGLELFVGHMGVNELAKFSYRECKEGYEVVMEFRGDRRFALCQHKNDAEVIVECLNNKKSNKPDERG